MRKGPCKLGQVDNDLARPQGNQFHGTARNIFLSQAMHQLVQMRARPDEDGYRMFAIRILLQSLFGQLYRDGLGHGHGVVEVAASVPALALLVSVDPVAPTVVLAATLAYGTLRVASSEFRDGPRLALLQSSMIQIELSSRGS